MEEDQLNALLKDEYLLLQSFYEDFDRRALLIKGWSVTVSVGGLAVGFERERPEIWILAGLAGILFWLIDAKWRTYQYANRKRIKEIEKHFRGEGTDNIAPFQIYSSWWEGYETQSVLRRLWMPLVMLPHVIAVAVATLLSLVHYFFMELV